MTNLTISPWFLLRRLFGWVVGYALCFKHCWGDSGVVGGGGNETLVGHLSIAFAHGAEGSGYALDDAVVGEDFRLIVQLAVLRIAPTVVLLYRQMRVGIDGQRHAVVLVVQDGDLVGEIAFHHCRSAVENHGAGRRQPLAYYPLHRVLATAKVVHHLLRFLGGRTLVGDLVSLVATEDFDDVALLGQLDTLLVGPRPEAPELDAHAVRPAVIEAVRAAFA